jgi:hypothetical protein
MDRQTGMDRQRELGQASGSSGRVAVIGGDGIGPDVIAEALKVVAASGVRLDTTTTSVPRTT